jgi:hypothetical protein
MIFMQFTVAASRSRLRRLPDVMIFLIIVLVFAHAAPMSILPLAMNGWLGSRLVRRGSTPEHGQRQ